MTRAHRIRRLSKSGSRACSSRASTSPRRSPAHTAMKTSTARSRRQARPSRQWQRAAADYFSVKPTGQGWPTLRDEPLLNRFFASESSLAKELNARCLNDALWQGRDGKKSVLYAGPQRSASGQSRPSDYGIARFHAYKNADRFCQRFFSWDLCGLNGQS